MKKRIWILLAILVTVSCQKIDLAHKQVQLNWNYSIAIKNNDGEISIDTILPGENGIPKNAWLMWQPLDEYGGIWMMFMNDELIQTIQYQSSGYRTSVPGSSILFEEFTDHLTGQVLFLGKLDGRNRYSTDFPISHNHYQDSEIKNFLTIDR